MVEPNATQDLSIADDPSATQEMDVLAELSAEDDPILVGRPRPPRSRDAAYEMSVVYDLSVAYHLRAAAEVADVDRENVTGPPAVRRHGRSRRRLAVVVGAVVLVVLVGLSVAAAASAVGGGTSGAPAAGHPSEAVALQGPADEGEPPNVVPAPGGQEATASAGVRTPATSVVPAVPVASANPVPSTTAPLPPAPPVPPEPVTTSYEAENAVISAAGVDSVHSGFRGTGYVNYVNAPGGYTRWTVTVGHAGTATLTFGYCNADWVDRPMEIRVNGVLVLAVAFPRTGGSWTSWSTLSVPLQLPAGTSTLQATAISSSGGPNVDYLDVRL